MGCTIFVLLHAAILRRNMEMDNVVAIGVLAALAHERRMSVFHLLSGSGKAGMNAGAIATALGVPPSSLSFHLTHLEQSGLISSKRFKRQIIYVVVPERFTDLVIFLIKEGAIGNPEFTESVISRASNLR